jgi:membrane-associated phospholipid phosphatase
MGDRDVKEAWRFYLLNWMPVFFLALLLIVGLVVTDFSLKIEGLFPVVVGVACVFTAAGHGLVRAGYPRLAFMLVSIAQLELVVLLVTPLTYIAASVNFPLQDSNLAFVDRMLGLDWQAYYNWIYERPALVPYVYLSYAMIGGPVFGVPILLGLTKNYRRLQQFTFACTLTLVATAIISSLLPAFGTYYQYGVSADTPIFRASGYLVQLHELPQVRDGSLRVLFPSSLGGIITFPSFHAAAGVLAIWAFWGVWWMRPFALIVYIAMILATPLVGGHYFIDVFAGVGLAVLAIALAKRVGESRSVAAPIVTRDAVTA